MTHLEGPAQLLVAFRPCWELVWLCHGQDWLSTLVWSSSWCPFENWCTRQPGSKPRSKRTAGGVGEGKCRMAFPLSDLGLLQALIAVMASSGECWAMGLPLSEGMSWKCSELSSQSLLLPCTALKHFGQSLHHHQLSLLDLSKCGPWPGENLRDLSFTAKNFSVPSF